MSAIMNALRKVEDEKKSASIDSGDPDRRFLADGEGGNARPVRRFAVVIGAVVVSGLAGAAVTLAALSFWQSNRFELPGQHALTAVGAPDALAPATTTVVEVASNKEGDAKGIERTAEQQIERTAEQEEPTVIVVADILARSELLRATATKPASHAALAEPVVRSIPPIAARSALPTSAQGTLAAVSAAEPTPLTARSTTKRDPVEELAASREARLSRASASEPVAVTTPPETRSAQAVSKPVASPVKTARPALPTPATAAPKKVAPARAAAPKPPERVAAVTEPAPRELASAKSFEDKSDPGRGAAREPVPRITVNGTTWHPRSQRRSAEISVEEAGETRIVTLREGQMLGPLKLSEIGPTSVTFLQDGVKVRHQIGAVPR